MNNQPSSKSPGHTKNLRENPLPKTDKHPETAALEKKVKDLECDVERLRRQNETLYSEVGRLNRDLRGKNLTIGTLERSLKSQMAAERRLWEIVGTGDPSNSTGSFPSWTVLMQTARMEIEHLREENKKLLRIPSATDETFSDTIPSPSEIYSPRKKVALGVVRKLADVTDSVEILAPILPNKKAKRKH